MEFSAGDFLIIQLESGYALIRVLAIGESASGPIWHLAVYHQLFLSVEDAELWISKGTEPNFSVPHMALTARAFERTPAAYLSNKALTADELSSYRKWTESADHLVSDRSVLQMLGIR